jgi:DNA-binding transcriptional regulator YdaS (Cro superfamily)
MEIDHIKIIEVLGGPAAVATRLGIKVPSVYGWMPKGAGIPESRLIELGADIEAKGLYTRKQIRPNDWQQIWPELVHSAPEFVGAVVVMAGDALGYVGEGVKHG